MMQDRAVDPLHQSSRDGSQDSVARICISRAGGEHGNQSSSNTSARPGRQTAIFRGSVKSRAAQEDAELLPHSMEPNGILDQN